MSSSISRPEQEHHRAAYLWDELGFKEHFKDIFYSARLGHLKKRPNQNLPAIDRWPIDVIDQIFQEPDRGDVADLNPILFEHLIDGWIRDGRATGSRICGNGCVRNDSLRWESAISFVFFSSRYPAAQYHGGS